MQFNELQHSFQNELISILSRHISNDILKDTYEYALLPTGKLFRPNLAMAIYCDSSGRDSNECDSKIKNLNPYNIFHFAAALEFHHVYSLIHDDLPAMDNDSMRRGKESLHIKFPEWQALLVGDGFINLSYRSLSKITHPSLPLILKLFSWCLGPRGLIHGQAMDLSLDFSIDSSMEINKSFQYLRTTHILKTGRLLQIALLGGHLLALDSHNIKIKELKNIFRLGTSIGLIFQYIDDLTELANLDLNTHESQINPWHNHFKEDIQNDLELQIQKMKENFFYQNGKSLKQILNQYFEKMAGFLEKNQHNIFKKNIDVRPIIKLFP